MFLGIAAISHESAIGNDCSFSSSEGFILAALKIIILIGALLFAGFTLALENENKPKWAVLFKKIIACIFLGSFVLYVSCFQSFSAAPGIGWSRAAGLMIISIIGMTSFLLIFIKCIALLATKKKLGWHWVWIPLFIVMFIAAGWIQKV